MTHQTDVEGLRAKHAIVTKVCRANRGVEGAIDEALTRLRDEYLRLVEKDANRNANFHLVLTVDRWSDDCTAVSASEVHE